MMPFNPLRLSAVSLVAILAASSTNAIEANFLWGRICTPAALTGQAAVKRATAPIAKCGAAPTKFRELPSVGGEGNTSVALTIGFDPSTQRLCYTSPSLPEAPVIRVGVGHKLTIKLTNSLNDTETGQHMPINCPIELFGEISTCETRPHLAEMPGADGKYYPIMANEAHAADGTSNLHVHGLFVSPQPCSDEVLKSTIYPANWSAAVATTKGCQTTPDSLTYTYDLPTNHPAGLYWYHTHRHGEAEHTTQMGLTGAIVVEDQGDVHRRSIGVTDEVLVVGDVPNVGCVSGPLCDLKPATRGRYGPTPEADMPDAAVKEQATAAANEPVLDPRIDQINQGACTYGAKNLNGGVELWTLLLNGAPVPENANGTFPADGALLSKTMRPGQRQLFRLVNASANSFVAPKLALKQNGKLTVQKLEVFARDGVGLADATGRRHLTKFDVSKTPFVVPPASRLEFVVHAPPKGTTLYLQSDQVKPGCGGNAYPARRLLKITSAGTPVAPGRVDDQDLLTGTPSLAPYLSTLKAKPTVHRTLVFAEYSRDFTYSKTRWLGGKPASTDYNLNLTDFYIPQVASDDGEVDPKKTTLQPFVDGGAPQVTVHLHGKDSVTEEWLVENSTLEIHDFHMHQIHFRDVTTASTNPDVQPLLDTITVPAAQLVGGISTGHPGKPGWVRLEMTFTRADVGEFVFHCHILEHEDSGMMGKVRVVAD
jgi:FtsP/CotA-like multicopper oxidase with cupredoxin domain